LLLSYKYSRILVAYVVAGMNLGMQGIVDVRMEMEMQWNADFYDEDDKDKEPLLKRQASLGVISNRDRKVYNAQQTHL